MLSQIQIIGASGYINDVNMAYPGAAVWSGPGGTGSTQTFGGQLGKEIDIPSEILRFNSTNGTVWGGLFRLVRLSASAGVPVVGQALFWDDSVSDQLYQVTTAENEFTYTSTNFCGVCLTPNLTVGNYTYVQTYGLVNVHYRAAISGTAATGRPVSLANQGAGADLGFFDIVNSDVPEYFVGYAVGLPINNSLGKINLTWRNQRN